MEMQEKHQTGSIVGILSGLHARSGVSARNLVLGMVMLAVFVAFMATIQFSTPNMPDNDGLYHIKLAYLMRTESLKPAFPWLPLSILNAREFYDHHFLFHVALIPFTFGDLVQGAKWASVIFAALAYLAIWRLLESQKIPLAPLWALGVLGVSEAFLYRMSITRAQSLSLAVLALSLNWLLAGKHKRMAALGFVYVWLYNAFPLLPAVAAVYTLAVWIGDRRLDLRPFVYTSLGVAAGLIINPYFPANIVFAYQHFVPKLFETTAVSVGNEWYPYTTAQLLSNSPAALLAFLSGGMALGLSGRRADARTVAAFLLAVLFGFMLFQSRRFVEYFPPFALLFAAFAWAPVIQAAPGEKKNRFRRELPALILVATLVPALWISHQGAQSSIQTSKPVGLYSEASRWLETNTPAGSRVFQTDWDDFPRLFFHNTHNTYLIGLDPTYMQLYDTELYDEWVQITDGDVAAPSRRIGGVFGAEYVLTDLKHKAFIRQAGKDPGLQEVFRDDEAIVYKVVIKQ